MDDPGLELKYAGGLPLQAETGAQGCGIEGYASLFGIADQGGDVIAAGAYAGSLARIAARGDRVRMLWQHAELAAHRHRVDSRVDAIDDDPALVRGHQGVEHPQRGGLATTRGPHHCNTLTLAYLNIHLCQCPCLYLLCAEDFL